MPDLHVLIPTHTDRHLRRVLLGLSAQTRPPNSVTVSCDNEDGAIRDCVRGACEETGLSVRLVQRAPGDSGNPGQVRNNAVRSLLDEAPGDDARLVFFDGDCCPVPDCLARHERLGGRDGLVVAFRIDLTPEQTDAFDDAALDGGAWPIEPTPEQTEALWARHRRYERQRRLRALGLTKNHKPKVLSANFSIPLRTFRDINGFDEAYAGWGQEDDDLGRRAYRAGARPVVGVAKAVALHLWHPTRAPGEWNESAGVARFHSRTPTRCELGLDSPAPQAPVRVEHIAPAGAGV